MIAEVNIKDIIVPEGRRPLDPAKVAEMAKSIKALGLLTPIQAFFDRRRSDWRAGDDDPEIICVAGAHRIEACRSLGWEKITVIFINDISTDPAIDASHRKMIEIAENLHRAELTAQQRNEHLAEWVKLLEQQGMISDTVSDIPGKPGRKPSAAVAKVAEGSGLSTKTIKRAVAASKVSPAVKAAADKAELSAKARLAVSRLPDDQQIEAVEKFAPPNKRPPTEPVTHDDEGEQVPDQNNLISVDEMNKKLGPIIDDLKAEGKKNMATMSPGTVARLAALLERQLDEWSGRESKFYGRKLKLN